MHRRDLLKGTASAGLAASGELTFCKAAAADWRTSLSGSWSKEVKAGTASLAWGPMWPRPLAAI